MDELNQLDQTTRERIDACRPESGDDRLPELAAAFEQVQRLPAAARHFDRVQQTDVAIRAAIHDVRVPAGLADRLLERLPTETISSAPASSNVKRDRAVWWQVGLAASLLVATTALFAWKWHPSQPTNVVTLADTWCQNLGDQWRPIATAPKSLAIPVPFSVAPRGWQPTAKLLGYHAVAYDFSRPGQRAILFVVQVSPEGGLPSLPPDSPQYSAGGRLLAAWITGKRMCLLVVEGDDRFYRELIRPQRGPIA